MRSFEQYIRRYEHGRWANEPNRRLIPFSWGLEHIGGRADEPNPREYLNRWVDETVANSGEWYFTLPAEDYVLKDGVVTFTSSIESPWPENNRVYAQFFPAKHSGPAVVVLAQWNARWEEQVNVCRWLNALGISALRISLPYHDRRAVPEHPRADFIVCSNIGLTLQANRQAITDVRRCVRWLERQGYDKIGILGTSLGSSLAFIAAAHEPAIRAGAFLHVSTFFGDVLANGLTTSNVWEPMKAKISPEECRRFFLPISPYPYVSRMRGTRQRYLAISGSYDPTFWPEFTAQFYDSVKHNQVNFDTLQLPCGHYSMGEPPFSWVAGFRFGLFLFQSLT